MPARKGRDAAHHEQTRHTLLCGERRLLRISLGPDGRSLPPGRIFVDQAEAVDTASESLLAEMGVIGMAPIEPVASLALISET